ncbi:MAG: sulfur oxidation c-type cytochrome SoxX [Pseudomonadota bacterium]
MRKGVTLGIALAAGVAIGAAQANVIAPDDVAFNADDLEVSQSLTGVPGDPAKGRDYFLNRRLGNCLACHANADMAAEPFHGEVGPAMDGVGSRWSEAQLRAIVINSKQVFGDATVMPAFYRVAGKSRVREQFQGKTILEAQQVEDVVAYLLTLTD